MKMFYSLHYSGTPSNEFISSLVRASSSHDLISASQHLLLVGVLDGFEIINQTIYLCVCC